MTKTISDVRGARNELRHKLDIVQVISDELGPPTKSSGQDSFWCCPIHQENTPSFSAHKTMRIFKCFACQIGGDVVSWGEQYYGITLKESIRALADKYSVDISTFERPLTPQEIELLRFHDICDKASAHLNKQLLNSKDVLDWYQKDSGFTLDQIIDYEVGYSASTDALVTYLYNIFPNLSQDEVDKLEFSSRLLWNNSLVYPIKNEFGRTTRFYNKPITPPSDFGGKYVGTSSKHPLFTHKLLFGFHLLKKNLKNNRYIIRLVEGQKAAMAVGGAAIMGSAIHEEQIELLKEHSIREVKFAFDGDEAGKNASLKLLDNISLMNNISVFVTKTYDTLQPDDIFRLQGKEGVDTLFNNAVLPLQFFIDFKRSDDKVLSHENKSRLILELKNYLISITDINLGLSVNYLAEVLSVDPNDIRNTINEWKLVKDTLINRDAETSVIKNVLLTPKYWSVLKQNVIDVKTFTTTHFQYIFNALDSIHKKSRDLSGADSVTIQTVKDELTILYPQFKALPDAIDSILNTESKYEFYDALKRTLDLYRRRLSIDQSRMLIAEMQDTGKDSSELISQFRRQIVSSIDIKKNDIATPKDLAISLQNELESRGAKDGGIIGLDFSRLVDVDGQNVPGMVNFATALSGLQPSHQVIISGNTGTGKSLIALNIATAISICPPIEDQVPILWIPLEMTPMEISMRIASLITGINNNVVQRGRFTNEQQLKMKLALDRIAQSKFYIKKPRYGTVDEIFSIVDEYHFKYGIKAAFLDYIQLIAHGKEDRGASREEVIGRASKMMKNQIAEGLNIASICISQQNRQNFKQGEPGHVENVSGSYQVSQDADDFAIIAAKTPEQMNADKTYKGNRVVFIDKRRGGQSDIRIEMDLDDYKNCSLRFSEIDNHNLDAQLKQG